ncbi:type IV pilin protein [Saccharobesus litoralis]|nr:type IV pilin protein [Saccharobesus litoralis]
MINQFSIRGFNLVELMICVAILGIIVSLAVPSYIHYIAQANRTEALKELVRVMNMQEGYYTEHGEYALLLSPAFGLPSDEHGFLYLFDSGHYKMRAQSQQTSLDVTLVIKAQGAQLQHDSQCADMRLSASGRKSSRDHKGNVTTQTCWYTN